MAPGRNASGKGYTMAKVPEVFLLLPEKWSQHQASEFKGWMTLLIV